VPQNLGKSEGKRDISVKRERGSSRREKTLAEKEGVNIQCRGTGKVTEIRRRGRGGREGGSRGLGEGGGGGRKATLGLQLRQDWKRKKENTGRRFPALRGNAW